MRDQLTTAHEQDALKAGRVQRGSLKADAIEVDAIVSTIGFPLVGGPAGSMEAGRQSEIAKTILASKNVPYVVAAPLLIQVTSASQYTSVLPLQPLQAKPATVWHQSHKGIVVLNK